MPELLSRELYEDTYVAARALLRVGFRPSRMILEPGTSLYHYNTAWFGVGAQLEEASRAFFKEPQADEKNRWTGASSDPGRYPGKAGLYMVLGERKVGYSTAEMFHYMTKDSTTINPNISNPEVMHNLEYWQFAKHQSPRPMDAKATRLYWNFAFVLTERKVLFDLQLPFSENDPISFVAATYRTLVGKHDKYLGMASRGGMFGGMGSRRATQGVRSYYTADQDASFCRAIGNACLHYEGCDGVVVSSARDLGSKNVIFKQPVGLPVSTAAKAGTESESAQLANVHPVQWLEFIGRISCFTRELGGEVLEMAETIADIQYNTQHYSARPKESKEALRDVLRGNGKDPSATL